MLRKGSHVRFFSLFSHVVKVVSILIYFSEHGDHMQMYHNGLPIAILLFPPAIFMFPPGISILKFQFQLLSPDKKYTVLHINLFTIFTMFIHKLRNGYFTCQIGLPDTDHKYLLIYVIRFSEDVTLLCWNWS